MVSHMIKSAQTLNHSMTEWVNLQFLNGTSAELGYTVPFTSVHAGKYMTEDKSKTDTLQKLNTTQKKQPAQNTAKQN